MALISGIIMGSIGDSYTIKNKGNDITCDKELCEGLRIGQKVYVSYDFGTMEVVGLMLASDLDDVHPTSPPPHPEAVVPKYDHEVLPSI